MLIGLSQYRIGAILAYITLKSLKERNVVAKQNPYRPFTPNPELMALWPDNISGNAINGVGETEVRKPDIVWWATENDTSSFADMQQWFYRHEPKDETLMALRRKRRDIIDAPLPDLAYTAADKTPDEWTGELGRFVDKGVCEKVGVTKLRQEWVYTHHRTEFKNVLLLGVAHDFEELITAPTLQAGIEVTHQYCRAASAAKEVASWLRYQGWDAEPVTGPMVGKILMIPHALEAGFGELGKHGSLITPEFGSAFRLGAVLTNAPFAPSQKVTHGINDFCLNCRVCEDACPPVAIQPEKKMVRGEKRWSVDFDKCIPFFAETSGCAICIAVCPWSRPGVGPKLTEKLAQRAERLDKG